ncbi:MBL fold metallo-hydrolase [Luedemannella helvata]|uniref:MBL fold metallo-hydrolase n=1 Tax=Luedemannella helvata TaxID=349315 RepID=A0ABP4WV95_9ACTN
MTFTEIANGVYVLRQPLFDVNATVVTGAEAVIVVDSLSTARQATELLAAVRQVSAEPLVLVNTHHHFDHTFGNATLTAASPGAAIWAHGAVADVLRQHPDRVRREAYDECVLTHPELADEVLEVTVAPPDRLVQTVAVLDIGGRTVTLRHLGRGHTDGDLVARVDDTGTIVAGDLVEQGAPPSFDDAYPLDWPETLAALIADADPDAAVVPGHGAVVDLAFVRDQHTELTDLAWLIREGHLDGAPAEAVAAKAAFGPQRSLVAVRRGYAELAGLS